MFDGTFSSLPFKINKYPYVIYKQHICINNIQNETKVQTSIGQGNDDDIV